MHLKLLKKPLTCDKQLDLLIERGLIITDREKALTTLQQISYYRLSGYMLSFKKNDHFYKNVTFNNIVDVYEFDQKFKNTLIEILENIEIEFRTHIGNHISIKYGALGYRDLNNFDNEMYHRDFISALDTELSKRKEPFIIHHRENYNNQFPFWVAIEVCSFGNISKLFNILKKEDKRLISKTYYHNIPTKYIESWLRCLVDIRNICAHYGKLYNTKLVSTPKLFNNDISKIPKINFIYSVIYIMKRMCNNTNKWDNFIIELSSLIEKYDQAIKLNLIGFPTNWEYSLSSDQIPYKEILNQ